MRAFEARLEAERKEVVNDMLEKMIRRRAIADDGWKILADKAHEEIGKWQAKAESWKSKAEALQAKVEKWESQASSQETKKSKKMASKAHSETDGWKAKAQIWALQARCNGWQLKQAQLQADAARNLAEVWEAMVKEDHARLQEIAAAQQDRFKEIRGRIELQRVEARALLDEHLARFPRPDPRHDKVVTAFDKVLDDLAGLAKSLRN